MRSEQCGICVFVAVYIVSVSSWWCALHAFGAMWYLRVRGSVYCLCKFVVLCIVSVSSWRCALSV